MGYLVEFVATTAEFVNAVILETKLRIRTEAEIGIETECLVVQFRQLRVAIAIMVITLSGAVLTVGVYTSLVVVGHQRDIARSHIVKAVRTALRHECMAEGSRIARWLLGDDVDGAAYGRRAEEG